MSTTVTITTAEVDVTATETGVDVTVAPATITVSTADGISQAALDAALAGYEPLLGNPASDGYVLSSTAAGVRSWIPAASGGGSVDFTAGIAIGPDGTITDPNFEALIAADDYGYTPRTGQVSGIQLNISLTGAAQGGQLAALNFYTDTGDATNAPTVVLGASGSAWHGAPNDATLIAGMNATAGSYSGNAVASLIGVNATVYPNGTTAEAIGMRVQDVSGAAVNYGIYTGAGANRLGDYLDLAEISAPGAPSNTHARLFARDNGGKTELCFRAASGSVIVIAAEP